ncbi:MAG: hypothetical protein K0B16_17930, partial [Burkholderiaceae bacterium]|nr:hypothetical protein [Burkholderiaceae bacterium]
MGGQVHCGKKICFYYGLCKVFCNCHESALCSRLMQTYALATSAPHSLDELRVLVAGIRRGVAGIRLGNRASDALAQLVDAPRHTAISSILELAEATGVNPSTLTRLTHKLGYKGFHEFQDVFRRSIASGSDESGPSKTGA